MELIYLNASGQIQNERGLGFICKISGLPCQEQALLKCFWSLIFDNLTMSDQNNPFELTALQNNWNCFRIKSNFALNERFFFSDFTLGVELCSLRASTTWIRYRYQWVIIDNEIITGFKLDCCLCITIFITIQLSSYLGEPPFIIWSYKISLFETFSRDSNWSWGIKRLTLSKSLSDISDK